MTLKSRHVVLSGIVLSDEEIERHCLTQFDLKKALAMKHVSPECAATMLEEIYDVIAIYPQVSPG